jgi:hypothetical protein
MKSKWIRVEYLDLRLANIKCSINMVSYYLHDVYARCGLISYSLYQKDCFGAQKLYWVITS